MPEIQSPKSAKLRLIERPLSALSDFDPRHQGGRNEFTSSLFRYWHGGTGIPARQQRVPVASEERTRLVRNFETPSDPDPGIDTSLPPWWGDAIYDGKNT